MKLRYVIFLIGIFLFGIFSITSIHAQDKIEPEICTTPQGSFSCLLEDGGLTDSGEVTPPGLSKRCASSYQEWQENPRMSYWVNDEKVTAAWKEGERSRQFLYWVVSHNSIDTAPAIFKVWSVSRNIAIFLLVLVAMFMGLGVIVGRLNIGIISDMQSRLNIMSLFKKLFFLILFVIMSATFFITIVQLADILMEFFIKRMGGSQLFNIFYLGGVGDGMSASEQSYQQFQGCKNLNVNTLESYRTSMFLIRFTNMSYYAIGIMMILRKIVLWFLMFVSPFLAILMPFTLIRNTGWIWIGVFFQWVFYGPLFGLFLGSMRLIWNDAIVHIPYIFDFSRRNGTNIRDVIYPTAINILYGGPAQNQTDPITHLGVRNTSSYVDTFAEYIISLIMMWVAVLLPWLLLRIFRDYCCDGIYAMRNALVSLYDKPIPPSPSPSDIPPKPSRTFETSKIISEEKKVVEKTKLESIQEIKRASTEEIHKSLDMHMSKLTDIARFETNKIAREQVTRNIEYIKNPMRADTPTERQRYMNIRTELAERAIKGDELAKHTMVVLSSRDTEVIHNKQEIAKTISTIEDKQGTQEIVKNISSKVGAPISTTSQIINTYYHSASQNNQVVSAIANTTNTQVQNVKNILKQIASLSESDMPITQVISTIAKDNNISEQNVREVIKESSKDVKKVIEKEELFVKEKTTPEIAEKAVSEHIQAITSINKEISPKITVPTSVPIEEYEQTKSMWINHYENSEIPVTENISSRREWLQTDVVTITNLLNKLTSENEEIRLQGLEEVGYILPIFMINKLSGDELVVYLKAKLEAAKQVKNDLDKEDEIKAKLEKESDKESDKVKIEVDRKGEEEKALEMEREMEIEQGKDDDKKIDNEEKQENN